MVVVVGQPITRTDPISGSSLDVSLTCPGVSQDVREDPELDILKVLIYIFHLYLQISGNCVIFSDSQVWGEVLQLTSPT